MLGDQVGPGARRPTVDKASAPKPVAKADVIDFQAAALIIRRRNAIRRALSSTRSDGGKTL